MTSPYLTRWVGAGLIALPVSALMTALSTLKPQPDQEKDPQAWAEFVTTPIYLTSHLIGSTGGTILGIFGFLALGIYLAGGRAARIAVPAMVIVVFAQALLLVPSVISTFVTPAVGHAYLAGIPEVMELEFPASMMGTFLLGLLLAFAAQVLLGVAVWRSTVLPKGAGALWIAAAVIFYPLGVVLGMVTTGSSLPTQPVGALLAAVAGGWIAWTAVHVPRQRSRHPRGG
ncbi:hypothetical protein I6N91_15030 [Arthrobacter sp. MSA 4-2]|uniref:hypothetical protein n=1 Tax=Arthrobacter sp. MSA 4-2 TaxID=2794349 RepID=UPI0018E72CDB|nr:hypothetical protein [Arthrobacter sp. MSA 4-2]MBJ2122295.1 hypothetical protein [Arthrobacter sp. MSA 4-2]